ncbi:DUF6314 family protein [Modicisalibacter luteus]|uniref:DUF6314 family protein n=1 Tax=Modicisalibacter luteus TaxID=453962 RepID=A0ABV7M0Q5_9GAMM|nr:DUF6314 family protein [Halomonas lutea]
MVDQPSIAGAQARILQLRRHLSSLVSVSFRSRSGPHSQCHWSGQGNGQIQVAQAEDDSLLIHESGHFQLDIPAPSYEHRPVASEPRPIPFRNVFRWRFFEDRVSLSHERRGAESAVWLFDLVAAPGATDLISHRPHLCIDDHYLAKLAFEPDGFNLTWRITGPRKDEQIHYRYRSA